MKQRYSNPRVESIAKFMFEFTHENKYLPSIREIAVAANIPSTSVTNYYLDRMEENGLVHRNRRISRGTSLTHMGNDYARGLLGLPKLKLDAEHCAACGAPISEDGFYEKPVQPKAKAYQALIPA